MSDDRGEATRQKLKIAGMGLRVPEILFVPFASRLIPPWIVLAASDGVWKYIGWDRLREAGARLRSQTLVDSLQEQARLPGSRRFQDDFTLVVVQDGEGSAAQVGVG
jgi:hypothetical protein